MVFFYSDWRDEYEDVSDLHYAAFYGDKGSVKRILKSSLDPSPDHPTSGGPKLLKQERHFTQDRFSQQCHFGFFLNTTPLMMASQQGHIDVVKYLTEHAHADINARDTLGMTSLGFASASGEREVVKYLISKRALINVQEYHTGMTPLILAAVNNHTETVRLLEGRHANVHLRDKFGRRALHYAAWNYNWELVSFLAKHNDVEIEINVQDYHGNTPLHLLLSTMDLLDADDFQTARERHLFKAILDRISRSKDVMCVDIRRIFKRGSGNVGELLTCFMNIVQLGADVLTSNNAGQTVLHIVCENLPPVIYSHGFLKIDDTIQTQNMLVIMHVLLKQGSICDVSDYEGNTPLSLSASQDNWLAVKLLGRHVQTQPRCDVTVDAFESLAQAITAFGGWNHVIKLSDFEQDIKFISAALLVRANQKPKDKLAERILNLEAVY